VANDSANYQQRFSQLAQHAFRVKVAVLLLLLVALFVVWSTLTNGNARAKEVDEAFCSQIIKDPYFGPLYFSAKYSCNSVTMMRLTLEKARHYDNDPHPNKMSEDVEKKLHDFLDHAQQFNDYDWNRRQAYRIELSLPYTKNAVPLNGSLISDAWPFCMLLALSVAISLGFRQTCYEIQLSALIREEKQSKVFGRDSALAEFLVRDISEVKHDGQTVFLYKRPIGLFPEAITSGVLFAAVSTLSLNLLTDYSPQFTERGHEIFDDYYYIWLYAFSVVLFLLLLRTRKTWMTAIEKSLGGEVRNARWFFLYRWLRFLRDKSFGGVRLESALILMVVGVGLAGLFLPWGSYRGFTLLCCPRRVFSGDDERLVARFIQMLMLVPVILLIAGGASRLPILVHQRRLHAVIQKVQTFTAWPVLIVIGIIIFYSFIGAYGSVKDFYVAPALGLFSSEALLNLSNLPVPEADDFSVGFVMFAVSCGILAVLELCFRQGRKSGRQIILGEPQNG
jgi:hypothetical protein